MEVDPFGIVALWRASTTDTATVEPLAWWPDAEPMRGALLYRITAEAERQTGLQEGDVLVAINNTRIADAAEVAEVIGALRSNRGFRLFFERGRRILFTDLYF